MRASLHLSVAMVRWFACRPEGVVLVSIVKFSNLLFRFQSFVLPRMILQGAALTFSAHTKKGEE